MHACAAIFKCYEIKYYTTFRKMTEERVLSEEQVEERRVEADNIAQLSNMPNIGSKPSQPRHFNFPKRPFGKKNVVYRSFQAVWFDRWQWLHYDCSRDVAFCFTCIKAIKTGKMKVRKWKCERLFVYYVAM